MDSNLTLINCITLAYLENESEGTVNSKELIKDIVESVNIPDGSVEMTTEADVIISLRTMVLWTISEVDNKSLDKSQFLQRLRVATKSKTYLYDAVENAIKYDDEKKLIQSALKFRKALHDHFNTIKLKKMIKDVYFRTNGEPIANYQDLAREITQDLDIFTSKGIDDQHPCIVGKVNFDNEEEIEQQMQRSITEVSDAGVLTTGYQAINRMLGQQAGFRRGEFCIIGALQHNYKTGFTLNLFKHLALYNKPNMLDETKKPLLIHVSLENDLHLNVTQLYASIKENETGEKVDISNIDRKEAAKYVKEKLSVNGYNVAMARLDPSTTSFQELMDFISEYEAQGFEVHAVVCDYLNMLNRKGLDRNGPMGTDIRELLRRLRNFCAPKAITFITPHQLSTEAKILMRQGIENFAQEVANKGYWDGSKQIDQEVDLEMIIHIEKVRGVGSYLTVARGKHRKIEITPEKDLTCILPFHDVGGVLDDVNGEDLSIKSIGSSSGGDWLDD